MVNIDTLDSDKVNTDNIIRLLVDVRTKYLMKEPEEVSKAIIEIQKFFSIETPQYVSEPEYDSNGRLVKFGVEQHILYQFNPVNLVDFNGHVHVIDKAMKVCPFVIKDFREQLKKFKEGTGSFPFAPLPPTANPPPAPKSPQRSIGDMLHLTKQKPPEKDPSDAQVEEQIRYVNEIMYRWGIWKEWFYTSLKSGSNVTSWSDIFDRMDMESHLMRISEFFNYWITTRFMLVYGYANDRNLDVLLEHTDSFFNSLARTSHETKQMTGGFQPQ